MKVWSSFLFKYDVTTYIYVCMCRPKVVEFQAKFFTCATYLASYVYQENGRFRTKFQH